MAPISFKHFFLIALSFLIVSLGSPSLSPFLGLLAASFGYALFWFAALKMDRRRRFFLSVVWFSGVQAVQLSWMTSTVYMGPLIWIVYFFLLAGLGLQFGFMTWLIRLPLDWRQAAGLAGFWVLMEWIRLFFLSGFTWNPVGLSLAGNSFSIQFAALFGIYGLCFWVMWVNLFALMALHSGRWIFWGGVALLPYFYGVVQTAVVEMYFKESSSIKVALIQTGMRPEQRDEMLFQGGSYIHPLLQWMRILSYLSATAQEHFDLIIFPEGALPGGATSRTYLLEAVRTAWQDHFGAYSEGDFPDLAMPFAKDDSSLVTNSFWAQSIANHYGAEVIVGLDAKEGRAKYNAAFHFKPNNLPIERYEKQILIPGGEYIPLRHWKWMSRFFAEKIGVETFWDPGHGAKVFSGAFPLGIFICLEETYSQLVREVRRAGAAILVSISNDVWFPETRLPWHHFDHGRIRAAENGIALLRACNTGVTAAVDCFGAPIKTLPVSEDFAGVLIVQVPVRSYPTLYTLLGDLPLIAASGFFFSLWVLRKKKLL